jgi:hypothetical protein
VVRPPASALPTIDRSPSAIIQLRWLTLRLIGRCHEVALLLQELIQHKFHGDIRFHVHGFPIQQRGPIASRARTRIWLPASNPQHPYFYEYLRVLKCATVDRFHMTTRTTLSEPAFFQEGRSPLTLRPSPLAPAFLIYGTGIRNRSKVLKT